MGMSAFTKDERVRTDPDFGTNIGSDVWASSGHNGSDLRQRIPFFAVSGYADLGNPEGWNPAFRNDWSFH